MKQATKDIIAQRVIYEVIDPLLSYPIDGKLHHNLITLIINILDNPKIENEVAPFELLEDLEDLDY